MTDHHGDTCDQIYQQAPFCGGPSLRECAGGVEVPEDSPCPGNDITALGAAVATPDEVGGVHESSQEPSNSHDPTPARDDCTLESVTEPPVPPVQPDTLPATGAMEFLLLWVAIGMITVGVALHMAMTDLMESGR